MPNPYYNGGAFPATGAPATSASMRAELASISAGFDKLPTLSTNAGRFALVNASATALTVSSVLSEASGNITIAGGLAVTGTLSGTGFSSYLASPPAIGGTTPAAGAFTTLSASSTVSGAGFSTYLASPPAIGGTAAAAGSFTTLSASGAVTLSGGTANGVLYLNGSKVATSGSALTFDGTNFTTTGYAAGNGLRSLFGNAVRFYNSLNSNWSQISAPAGTGDMQFDTGAGEQMRLTSTGLGIGGTPTQKLDVFGDIQQQNANYLRGRLAAGTATRLFGLNSANSLYIGGIDASQSEMLFVRGGATQMVLDSSGNLGIGTSSPGQRLEIQAPAGASQNATIRLRATDSGSGAGSVADIAAVGTGSQLSALAFSTRDGVNVVERMRLDSSGNVGIGTSSPTQRLDVNGRGIFTVADNTYATAFNATTGNLRITPYESSTYSSTALVAYSAGYAGYGPLTVDALNHRWWVSGTEQMRLTSTGLGIGTSSPSNRLQVTAASGGYWNGSGWTGTPTAVVITNSTIGGYDPVVIGQMTDSGGTSKNSFAIGTVGTGVWTAGNNASQIADLYIAVRDNAGGITERARITSDGNLGIGTSAPIAKLTISNGNQALIGGGYVSIPALSTALVLNEITSNAAATGQSDYGFLRLSAGGGTTLGFKTAIDLQGYGTTDNSQIRFYTSGTQRAVIDSSGNLGLGVTPSAWGNGVSLQGNAWSISTTTGFDSAAFATNARQTAYGSGSQNWVYRGSAAAANYEQVAGQHRWFTSPSGTAGNAITFTQAMTLNDSGNLGLGVTPSAWISAYRAIDLGATGAVYGRTDSSIEVSLAANGYRNSSGNWIYRQTAIAGISGYDTSGAWYWKTAPSGTAGNTISFTQVMTLDPSGNLGVGTTSPVNYGGTFTTLAINNSGAGVLDLMSGGVSQFRLFGNASENRLQGVTNVPMTFYTNNTERARITSGGDFLVTATSAGNNGITLTGGTTTPAVGLAGSSSTAGNYGITLYSSGASANRFLVDYAGTIFATNTTISAVSDQRFKENVRDLDVGLSAIMALKPRKFDWKTGKGKDIKNDRGFIAQEFEQVFPDLVDKWADPAPEGEEPYKSVRQDLIPVLVKAIQELAARVAQLERN